MGKKKVLLLLLLSVVAISLAACTGDPGAKGPPGIPGTGITVLVDCQINEDTRVVQTSREIKFRFDRDQLEVEVSLPDECGGGTLKGKLPLLEVGK